MKHEEREEEKHLIVGLGNPGREYQNTPHNIGWRIVEAIAEDYDCHFKNNKATLGKFCQFASDKHRVFLQLPETYMNKSGLSVKSSLQYWNIGVNNLLVVQDDSDMCLGKIKFGSDQSSGGHKGMESIITALGSQKFARLKIGVRPLFLPQGGKKHVKAEKFILGKLPDKQEKNVLELAKEAILYWIAETTEKAMNKYN